MSSISASGNVYIRQDASGIQYNVNNTSWNPLTFPVTVINTNAISSNILNVLFTTNIITTSTSCKFIAGSNYINFDGLNNTLTINTTLPNGSGIFLSNEKIVTVQNFIIRGTGTMNALCIDFGKFANGTCKLLNCINYKDGINLISDNSASFGDALISGCVNYGYLTKGISGNNIAVSGGRCVIESCSNQNNNAIDPNCGAICGVQAGGGGGKVTITNCFSNCALTNTGSAGIAGPYFGYNTDSSCSITNCYSTGNISDNCFGICSNDLGYNNASGVGWNPKVNITNCYSLGTISGSNSAGIVGKSTQVNSNTPTVNITNCYSYGTNSGSNGIQSASSYTVTNCYAANGSWSDADASNNLTGTPTSLYVNNPGTTWASIVSDTPYVLSSFNSDIYDPNSETDITSSYVTTLGTYTSAQGVFQSTYDYNLLSVNDSAPTDASIDANNGEITFTNVPYKSTDTAEVFVSQGTAPYYTNYNLNTFAYSNSCFPAKTPIQTDQGSVNIDEINTEVHTIRNKKIVAVTKIVSQDKHVVCFEQDSLGKNIPSQKTIISQNHELLYKGKMMKAKDFVGSVDNVYMKKYNGEVLYNVLMEEHDKMIVNNLVCETLDPKNRIAKLYMMLQKMTPERQETFIKKFNEAQENEEEIKRNKCVAKK